MLPSLPVKLGNYSSVLWKEWVTTVSEENYKAVWVPSCYWRLWCCVQWIPRDYLVCWVFLLVQPMAYGHLCPAQFCHWGCTSIDIFCFSIRWISMPSYKRWHQIHIYRESESLIVQKKEECSSGFGFFLPLCILRAAGALCESVVVQHQCADSLSPINLNIFWEKEHIKTQMSQYWHVLCYCITRCL